MHVFRYWGQTSKYNYRRSDPSIKGLQGSMAQSRRRCWSMWCVPASQGPGVCQPMEFANWAWCSTFEPCVSKTVYYPISRRRDIERFWVPSAALSGSQQDMYTFTAIKLANFSIILFWVDMLRLNVHREKSEWPVLNARQRINFYMTQRVKGLNCLLSKKVSIYSVLDDSCSKESLDIG